MVQNSFPNFVEPDLTLFLSLHREEPAANRVFYSISGLLFKILDRRVIS